MKGDSFRLRLPQLVRHNTCRLTLLPLMALLAFWVPMAKASYQTEVMTDTPSSYYQLNHVDGATTATDSSGYGRDVTFQGSSSNFVASPFGQGVSFASADYFTGALQDGDAIYSMEAWVRLDSTTGRVGLMHAGSNMHVLVGSCADNDSPAGAGGPCIKYLGSSWVSSGWAFPDTTNWYHIVIVQNVTDVKLYVNGSLESTRTVSRSGTSPMAFGESSGWGGAVSMDEVAVYDQNLTQTRIAAHANAFNAPSGSGQQSVTASIADTLTATFPGDISFVSLPVSSSNETPAQSMTVYSNQSWGVKIASDHIDGRMQEWDGNSYNNTNKLTSSLQWKRISVGGSADASSYTNLSTTPALIKGTLTPTGNGGRAIEVGFNQPIAYVDDADANYRTVVAYEAAQGF